VTGIYALMIIFDYIAHPELQNKLLLYFWLAACYLYIVRHRPYFLDRKDHAEHTEMDSWDKLKHYVRQYYDDEHKVKLVFACSEFEKRYPGHPMFYNSARECCFIKLL